MNQPIPKRFQYMEKFKFSVRAWNLIVVHEIDTEKRLRSISRDAFLAMKGFGPVVVNEVMSKLVAGEKG